MKDEKEKMSIADLRKTDWIIYESIVGSHAYNTNIKLSDTDLRGIFVYPDSIHIGLDKPEPQVGDEKHDIVFYSLKKIFELLKGSNPNIIELLWMPEDCIKQIKPQMVEIIKNRDLFISKVCFETHSGYARGQISKARGSNKKVHNPEPKEQPKKEDFCWIMPKEYLDPNPRDAHSYPCRPVPFSELSYNLSEFHVSSLEHTPNTYRLYHYGKKAKGVFRGNDMLVCESIPKEDEFSHFSGLLIYNKDSYDKAIKNHKSYWTWIKNRNDARWIDQEKGKLTYDAKNMMHCARLLMSGENILRNGEPLVRFEGEQRDYLMSIRRGEMTYKQLMKDVDAKMVVLKDLYENSTAIPDEVDQDKINELYQSLRRQYE